MTDKFYAMFLPAQEYVLMVFLAFIGSIARGHDWIGADGKIIWIKAISEIAAAVFIAVVAIASRRHQAC